MTGITTGTMVRGTPFPSGANESMPEVSMSSPGRRGSGQSGAFPASASCSGHDRPRDGGSNPLDLRTHAPLPRTASGIRVSYNCGRFRKGRATSGWVTNGIDVVDGYGAGGWSPSPRARLSRLTRRSRSGRGRSARCDGKYHSSPFSAIDVVHAGWVRAFMISRLPIVIRSGRLCSSK